MNTQHHRYFNSQFSWLLQSHHRFSPVTTYTSTPLKPAQIQTIFIIPSVHFPSERETEIPKMKRGQRKNKPKQLKLSLTRPLKQPILTQVSLLDRQNQQQQQQNQQQKQQQNQLFQKNPPQIISTINNGKPSRLQKDIESDCRHTHFPKFSKLDADVSDIGCSEILSQDFFWYFAFNSLYLSVILSKFTAFINPICVFCINWWILSMVVKLGFMACSWIPELFQLYTVFC